MATALATALALTLVAATPAGAERPRITVSREATVTSPTIRLGDIAMLEGEGAEALGGLTLGRAPIVGASRTLDGRHVLRRIEREVGDLASVGYTIPQTIRVRRAAQEVSSSAVRAILETWLAERLGDGAEDAVLRSVELATPVEIPTGPYEARVVAPAGAPLLGRVRLRLEFVVADRPTSSTWVTADIGHFGPVVLARRPVARGETVVAEDLTLERRDLSEVPRGVLTDVAEAVGQTARVALVPYAPIRRTQVAPPEVVHRGDAVLLVAERGVLRITATGEAREAAGLGEQVRVLNRASRKAVVGRVLDARTVAVEF